MITLYPLIEVNFGSNTIEMFNAIFNIVSFDVIPWIIMGPIQDKVIGEFPSDIPFNSGFAMMDFDGYIAVNLFPPVFVAVLIWLSYVYNWVRFKCCIWSKKAKRREHLEKYKGVYGFSLRFWIEMSLELGLCSMIELAMKQVGEEKEIASFFVSFVALLGTIYGISYLRK